MERILPFLSLLSRRRFLGTAGAAALAMASRPASAEAAAEPASTLNENVALTVNGRRHALDLDPRIIALQLEKIAIMTIAKIPIAQARRSRDFSNASVGTNKGGTAGRDKTPAAPCRYFKILAGKCGFTGQPERRNHRSGDREIGNAIPVLT